MSWLRNIFGEINGDSLRDTLPSGYTEHGTGRNDDVDLLLDISVTGMHTMMIDVADVRQDHPTWPKPWPGQEKTFFVGTN